MEGEVSKTGGGEMNRSSTHSCPEKMQNTAEYEKVVLHNLKQEALSPSSLNHNNDGDHQESVANNQKSESTEHSVTKESSSSAHSTGNRLQTNTTSTSVGKTAPSSSNSTNTSDTDNDTGSQNVANAGFNSSQNPSQNKNGEVTQLALKGIPTKQEPIDPEDDVVMEAVEQPSQESTSKTQAPQVVTKYVFIDKSKIKKSKKKSFGVLYLQAFKHLSKLHNRRLSKSKKQRWKKSVAKQPVQKAAKGSKVQSVGSQKAEKKAQVATSKSKKVAIRIRDSESEGKLGKNGQFKSRYLKFAEKLEIIKAMEKSTKAASRLAKQLKVPVHSIDKVWEDREEILAKAQKKDEAKKDNDDNRTSSRKQKRQASQNISYDERNFDEEDDQDDLLEFSPRDAKLGERYFTKNGKGKPKRFKKYQEIDKALLIWYRQKEKEKTEQNSGEIPLDIIVEQARVIASRLCLDFVPGKMWVLRWKRRYKLMPQNVIICDRECLQRLEESIEMSEIIGYQRIKAEVVDLSEPSPAKKQKTESGNISSELELDKALWRWHEAIERQVPDGKAVWITLKQLAAKAKEITQAQGTKFFPDYGWFLRWRKRHNLVNRTGVRYDGWELANLDSNVPIDNILEPIPEHFGFEESELSENSCDAELEREGFSEVGCDFSRGGVKFKEIDIILLKWFRAIEKAYGKEKTLSIPMRFFKDKAKEISILLGNRKEFPQRNWVLRWKDKHKLMYKVPVICSKKNLKKLEANVDMLEVIEDCSDQVIQAMDSADKSEDSRSSSAVVNTASVQPATAATDTKRTHLNLDETLWKWYEALHNESGLENALHIPIKLMLEKAQSIATEYGHCKLPNIRWLKAWLSRRNLYLKDGLICDTEPQETDDVTVGKKELVRDIESDDPDYCKPGSGRKKKRPRKDLTIAEKIRVVEALEDEGARVGDLARKYGVSVSSISRIKFTRDAIMAYAGKGECLTKRSRTRCSKDPELEHALLKWHKAMHEELGTDQPFSVTPMLLVEKAREIAEMMGKTYFPGPNWIMRWKARHGLDTKEGMIMDREILASLESGVNLAEILRGDLVPDFGPEMNARIKREAEERRRLKAEAMYHCDSCGELTNKKRGRLFNNHLPGCPNSGLRKELTMEEKVKVIRELDKGGVKMVTLAEKYGVSSGTISRISKLRDEFMAQYYSGTLSASRKRDRKGKEPEVEKLLSQWYKEQLEMGIHVTNITIREKVTEFAKMLDKNFYPTDSWIGRWRKRCCEAPATTFSEEEESESDNENNGRASQNGNVPSQDGSQNASSAGNSLQQGSNENMDTSMNAENFSADDAKKKSSKKKKELPKTLMCEKCGYVSLRSEAGEYPKRQFRHAKGCPTLKPRIELTFEKRLEILKALEEPGATMSAVARSYGISTSSLSRMNQMKEEIIAHGQKHASSKRIRLCKEPEVAQKLFEYYMEKKREGIHVIGPKLKEKARAIAASMGKDFGASSGWLGRWKQRYNIVMNPRPRKKDPLDPNEKTAVKKYVKKESKGGKKRTGSISSAGPAQSPTDMTMTEGRPATVVVDPGVDFPTPPVFLTQKVPNPWDPSHQPNGWQKDFLIEPVMPEDNHISYSYNETPPAHTAPRSTLLHTMVDPFQPISYHVSVDNSRDYLKGNTAGKSLPPANPIHQQQAHHHHHPQQHHHPHHLQQQHAPHPGSTPSPSSSIPHYMHQQPSTSHMRHVGLPQPSRHHSASPVREESEEQKRQVMEAFRVMSSFAAKQALGDQVQAALRTIEQSMKMGGSSANPFSSMQ